VRRFVGEAVVPVAEPERSTRRARRRRALQPLPSA